MKLQRNKAPSPLKGVINIIYIHGFRSGGKGGKYDRLKRRFRKGFSILSPTFSESIYVARRQLHQLMSERDVSAAERTVVIGTSLGGFYCYYLSVLYGLRAVIINPVLNPSEHMKKYVDTIQQNFRTGRKFKFSEKDINELGSMEKKIREKDSPDGRRKIFVVLGERDNVINREVVEDTFNNILYMDDGHEFNEYFDRLISMPGIRDFITL